MSNCTKCKVELNTTNCRIRHGIKEGQFYNYCLKCESIYQKHYRVYRDPLRNSHTPCSYFNPIKSRREWNNFSDYMRLNPVYFHTQFGKDYTTHNVYKEYKRLDKLMRERGI